MKLLICLICFLLIDSLFVFSLSQTDETVLKTSEQIVH